LHHFELHFEPQYRVLYQEPTGSWHTAIWQDIATAPSIKRIQYNSETLQNYIIIDIDNDNIYKFRESNLPEPNFIVKNKHKSGAHLFWVLDRTIVTPYYKKLWQKIFKDFTLKSGGDTLNKGFIGKNLNNNIDFDYLELEAVAYNINDLKQYIYKDTLKKEKSPYREDMSKKKVKVQGKGRNVDLFNKVRLVAYQDIKRSSNDDDFKMIILNYAKKLNKELFEYPLEINELEGIVKSIVKYCLENKSKIKKYEKTRGKMELDKLLSVKERQRLGANYSSKIKATKNEMKIKIAIIEMKKKELKINVSSVAKYTNLSRVTVTKNKHFFN